MKVVTVTKLFKRYRKELKKIRQTSITIITVHYPFKTPSLVNYETVNKTIHEPFDLADGTL